MGNISIKAFPKRERTFEPISEEELGRLMVKQAKIDMKRQTKDSGFRQKHKAENYTESENHSVARRLTVDMCRNVLEFIEKNPAACRGEIAESVPETARQARGRIEFLLRNGFIRREGGGRFVRYYRTDKPVKYGAQNGL